MEEILILVFDEEELTKTLIQNYLKEVTFLYKFEKYNIYDESFINDYNGNKIIIVNINKFNIDILNSISKLSQDKKNNFIIISNDNSTDLNVKSLRAGAKDFLSKPIVKTDFIYVVQRIYKKEYMDYNMNSNGKIYTAVSIERGMGKTTFLINLAKEIADASGEKVLLIDFNNDINDLSFLLNIDIVYNTIHYINNLTEENAAQLLSKVQSYKNSSLYVMANGFLRKGGKKINVLKIDDALNILKKHYKYIFLDIDPNDDKVERELVRLSDYVFVMMNTMMSSLEKLKSFLEIIYKSKNVKLILNKYEKKNVEKIEEIQSFLGREVTWIIPKNFMATGTALNNSKTLKEVAPNLDIVQSYIQLAKKIISRENV